MIWFVRESCFLDHLEVAAVLKWFARLHLQYGSNLQYRHTSGLEMWKIPNVYSSKRFTAVQTQMIRWNVYECDKTFNYTLWFCIPKSLKSLQNVPPITPDHTRSFLFWASPNNFSSLSHSPPQTEGAPILQMALRSQFFSSKVKTSQESRSLSNCKSLLLDVMI